VDELLRRADLAMYQAKAEGRNTMRFFDPAMQVVASARAALEADLRQSLQRDELLLYYQPIVDHASRITGFEALVRWRHPARGLVSPGDFIPLAEQTGLILPLGKWVLQTALSQLVAWSANAQTRALSISVNVSARQFNQADFVEQVLNVVQRTGANGSQLMLELTESLLVHNIEDVIEKMLALRAHGVCFALDDFGIGYSSLAYLKRMPLDQLKIDQSFVRDIMVDANDAAIAKTIVSLADSLGLQVLAEGVETQAQLALLGEQGCFHYQGFLFSEAVSSEALEAYIASLSRPTHPV
jgi:EAL domain-containing protein (putative c-di-GMP-specific phosphodiesterase class I)